MAWQPWQVRFAVLLFWGKSLFMSLHQLYEQMNDPTAGVWCDSQAYVRMCFQLGYENLKAQ